MPEEDVDREVRSALAAGQEKRALARAIAARSGRPAREIYARAVALHRPETGRAGKRPTKGS
jgi:hypothetical protein